MSHDPVINALATIRARKPNFSPRAAMILGSGLGAFADNLDNKVVIPYEVSCEYRRRSLGRARARQLTWHRYSVHERPRAFLRAPKYEGDDDACAYFQTFRV